MRIRNELQLHLVLGGSLAYLEQSIELQYMQFFFCTMMSFFTVRGCVIGVCLCS